MNPTEKCWREALGFASCIFCWQHKGRIGIIPAPLMGLCYLQILLNHWGYRTSTWNSLKHGGQAIFVSKMYHIDAHIGLTFDSFFKCHHRESHCMYVIMSLLTTTSQNIQRHKWICGPSGCAWGSLWQLLVCSFYLLIRKKCQKSLFLMGSPCCLYIEQLQECTCECPSETVRGTMNKNMVWKMFGSHC